MFISESFEFILFLDFKISSSIRKMFGRKIFNKAVEAMRDFSIGYHLVSWATSKFNSSSDDGKGELHKKAKTVDEKRQIYRVKCR